MCLCVYVCVCDCAEVSIPIVNKLWLITMLQNLHITYQSTNNVCKLCACVRNVVVCGVQRNVSLQCGELLYKLLGKPTNNNNSNNNDNNSNEANMSDVFNVFNNYQY